MSHVQYEYVCRWCTTVHWVSSPFMDGATCSDMDREADTGCDGPVKRNYKFGLSVVPGAGGSPSRRS